MKIGLRLAKLKCIYANNQLSFKGRHAGVRMPLYPGRSCFLRIYIDSDCPQFFLLIVAFLLFPNGLRHAGMKAMNDWYLCRTTRSTFYFGNGRLFLHPALIVPSSRFSRILQSMHPAVPMILPKRYSLLAHRYSHRLSALS